MKFFLDENIPKTCGDHLKSLSHELVDIRGTKNEGLDDRSIFKLAQINSAIFLTTDKDFFHTIPYLFEKHHGVIVISLSKPDRKSIKEKLLWILDNCDISNISDKVILLRDNSYLVK